MVYRPAWAEIDLAALKHNIALARRLCGRAVLFAVCKADAYGCGAGGTAATMRDAGVDGFAVADAADAERIRSAGVDSPILLYAGTTPDLIEATLDLDLIPTIHDFETLECLSRTGRSITAFIEVDCGFGRLGFAEAQWTDAFRRIAASPAILARGLYTHLSHPENAAVTERQAASFKRAAAAATTAGLNDLSLMAASSRVLLGNPGLTFDAVNPGRMLYGMVEPPWDTISGLRPVLRAVKSRVIQVRDLPEDSMVGYGDNPGMSRPKRTAVIAFGFKDGLPRLPAGGTVLIRGRRLPVVGARSTEHTIVDTSSLPEVAVGDEVVLLGSSGDEMLTGTEICDLYQVPMIELLPRLGRSLHRVYTG